MTPLWEKWKKTNSIIIKDVEDILIHRETFKMDHYNELYNETVTLCKFHHMEKLHKVYGKVPALTTAMKQKRWCERQRDKHNERSRSTEVG